MWARGNFASEVLLLMFFSWTWLTEPLSGFGVWLWIDQIIVRLDLTTITQQTAKKKSSC